LRKAFREGIEGGPHVAADSVFDRLEAKYLRLAEERGD
jgi:hypothetical protein